MRNLFFFVLICISIGVFSCRNNKKEDKAVKIVQDSIPLDTISKPDTLEKEVKKEDTETLEQVLEKIAKAYIDQDSKTINNYIHPKLGIYIIYRPGALDSYVHQNNFNFSKPVPEYHSYEKLSYKGPLKTGKLPVFDCGTMKWDKLGFFYDKKSRPNELSQTAKFMNEILDAKITGNELQRLRNIEVRSYRAIMTSNESEEPFVFHVTKEGEKWYITVIDRAYAGCDA
ncbi:MULTISPECIES: hypothetical protein [unclassified Sphingobacterium]|uniref:hypothetical protein n=1 Tax=unclassified Sphingobacterium TaxID=2609468 RepID=UPI0025D1FA39|nr:MULTISPECIES: hypothetical protein [unclassified Sphingobacterium]